MSSRNISFIGAGNVAEALCQGLKAAGHRIISVASLNGDSARVLAGANGAAWRRDLSVPENCDILILAVTDTAVAGVAREVILPDRTVIAHTAGSVSLDALGHRQRAGVFYPLQTFTKGFVADLKKVPFFIEATDKPSLNLLRELATDIGAGAWDCDSERRRHLHVAAVFANNFSNFMMTTGEAIATGAGFDPSLLRPLMEETVRKAMRTGPERAQTGPAVRHDDRTMESHLELLSFSPEYQKLYRMISRMITDHYKNTDR
ncbi:MAG TPA: F420-dependent NADP oxidoreductase [Bacteroidales bacterium]|nr:F420-dependent NADP oxidoreductase [Bacteroidales bacterium]